MHLITSSMSQRSMGTWRKQGSLPIKCFDLPRFTFENVCFRFLTIPHEKSRGAEGAGVPNRKKTQNPGPRRHSWKGNLHNKYLNKPTSSTLMLMMKSCSRIQSEQSAGTTEFIIYTKCWFIYFWAKCTKEKLFLIRKLYFRSLKSQNILMKFNIYHLKKYFF